MTEIWTKEIDLLAVKELVTKYRLLNLCRSTDIGLSETWIVASTNTGHFEVKHYARNFDLMTVRSTAVLLLAIAHIWDHFPVRELIVIGPSFQVHL